MKICIVRHGETDWNKLHKLQGRENIPLNQTGIEQAERVAVYLQQYTWDVIISSPLVRAKRTADIIAEKTGVKSIKEEADFIERDMGAASGMIDDQYRSMYPDKNVPCMESNDNMQKRMRSCLEKNLAVYKDQNIIIVSHGAAIRVLVSSLMEGAAGSYNDIVRNGSVTILEYKKDVFTMLVYNKADF